MSLTLTTLLAIVGGLVLAGVIAHGAWTARKAGPKRALPPLEEPHFDAPPVSTDVAAEVEELEVTLPAVARPLRRPSARIDALIDAIATITVEQPVTGDLALQHQPGSRRAGTKPLQIEGLNAASGDWELPAPGQRYGEFQAGLKMASRSGPLNEIEYSEFVQKIQAFADGVGGFVQFPDMLDVVARARELDQFAASHDAQLALLLRAKATAWTPGFVQQSAGRHGFVVGSLPGRLVLPAGEEGAPPVLTLQFDAQAALAEDPEALSLRELTLALDVPQTAAEQEPFALWQESARALARDLEAEVCDDRGQVLGLHAFAAIDVELKKLYAALAERDLAAGSPAARRLFS
ncbi:cell division protein ZipA C-terminal FtsZ-binding domain-containing protein [Roseateles sp.]|uniref:cell division protein ZipA C-terminal FtsZ-binding domain-containing protein n=1 Tax=Roseateles sp. TaxID=1971397 RepID=UPI0025CE324C|nr:cell division protein ZipA C-terminal FtsZ-binding domain-containing protein [Roseateles sp.]MBV8035750.1 cell division protein FtsZ [Roseateles sp.]